MTTAPKMRVQTVIVVETASGNFTVAVSCGIDAACRTIDECARKDGGQAFAEFSAPVPDGSTSRRIRLSYASCVRVVTVFEQEVIEVTDPRAIGMQRTASGITLPG